MNPLGRKSFDREDTFSTRFAKQVREERLHRSLDLDSADLVLCRQRASMGIANVVASMDPNTFEALDAKDLGHDPAKSLRHGQDDLVGADRDCSVALDLPCLDWNARSFPDNVFEGEDLRRNAVHEIGAGGAVRVKSFTDQDDVGLAHGRRLA